MTAGGRRRREGISFAFDRIRAPLDVRPTADPVARRSSVGPVVESCSRLFHRGCEYGEIDVLVASPRRGSGRERALFLAGTGSRAGLGGTTRRGAWHNGVPCFILEGSTRFGRAGAAVSPRRSIASPSRRAKRGRRVGMTTRLGLVRSRLCL